MKKCKDCYWYRWEDSIWGYCWRFPPKFVQFRNYFWQPSKIKIIRPEVDSETICCGEFKQK